MVSIQLQRRSNSEDDHGITDIEVAGVDFHLIIEAKKHGWATVSQLKMYADRLRLKTSGHLFLCSLGVAPVCDSHARRYAPDPRIKMIHARWHDVLEVVRTVSATTDGDSTDLLVEFAELIEEVIQMQSYDIEVLVRDIKFSDKSKELYYRNFLYNGGPRGTLEPLFFAPNFTKDSLVGMDGIQFISRVYYRDRFDIHNARNAAEALDQAQKLLPDRVEKLKKRKTTSQSVSYLESLPAHWKRGIEQMPSIWPTDKNEVAVYFLGKPMRLPVPLRKEGGMVAPGFNLTLEELLHVENKTLKC
jgi:hypothetical protein